MFPVSFILVILALFIVVVLWAVGLMTVPVWFWYVITFAGGMLFAAVIFTINQ